MGLFSPIHYSPCWTHPGCEVSKVPLTLQGYAGPNATLGLIIVQSVTKIQCSMWCSFYYSITTSSRFEPHTCTLLLVPFQHLKISHTWTVSTKSKTCETVTGRSPNSRAKNVVLLVCSFYRYSKNASFFFFKLFMTPLALHWKAFSKEAKVLSHRRHFHMVQKLWNLW